MSIMPEPGEGTLLEHPLPDPYQLQLWYYRSFRMASHVGDTLLLGPVAPHRCEWPTQQQHLPEQASLIRVSFNV